MILIKNNRQPAVWGFSSFVSSPQTSVPDGPHEWEMTGSGTSCRKCGIRLVLGTDAREDAVLHLAGRLCSDALAIAVLRS